MSKYKPMVTEYTNSLIYDIEVWLENTNRSQQIFDTLDICHLIGKIQYQQKEIERLNDLVHSLRESRLQEHQENIELQDRISEAIEYIESYMPNYDFDKTNLIKVLDILKGVVKE